MYPNSQVKPNKLSKIEPQSVPGHQHLQIELLRFLEFQICTNKGSKNRALSQFL